MPNATCFLLGYLIVLGFELLRFASSREWWRTWISRLAAGMFVIAMATHTLYWVDRVVQATRTSSLWRLLGTWHDWGIFAAWAMAIVYGWIAWRRSDKQMGLFILPWVVVIITLATFAPSQVSQAAQSSASFWRLVHSVAMTIGTMLVTLGFAAATMYFVQARRLKRKLVVAAPFRLPSLEYLQSFGRKCVIGSAASIGFGVVSGAIMNFTQDGRVEWTDRGILFSAGLFVWLLIAAGAQWFSSNQGRGEWTALVSVLSFLIVVFVLGSVIANPHGMEPKAWDQDRTKRNGDTIAEVCFRHSDGETS